MRSRDLPRTRARVATLVIAATLVGGCGDDGREGDALVDAGGDGVSDSAGDRGTRDGGADLESEAGSGLAAPTGVSAVGLRPVVAVSWDAVGGVVTYRVIRDGVEIAEVGGTSYLDTFAGSSAPATCASHTYTVRSVAAGGALSEPSAPATSALPVKNVVLMIGDGMGPEHERAAGCFLFGGAYGAPGSQLSFQRFPRAGLVQTASASAAITDSAAAATAMATGHAVNNGVVSVALPGDGSDLYTLLECFAERGRVTGLVTTTEISHATPAGFGAHAESRNNVSEIVADYLDGSRPNLLLGGRAGGGMTVGKAQTAGYQVVTTRTELAAVTGAPPMVSGQFADGHLPYEYDAARARTDPYQSIPHLDEQTERALALLGAHPGGFFLMVEGGRIDHASHANDLARMVDEMVAFESAVEVVRAWASTRDDTLVLVTADHETGGLAVGACGAAGTLPPASWSSGGHTSANVNVYALGPLSERFVGTIPNTAFFDLVTSGD